MSETNVPPNVARKLSAIRRRALAVTFLRGVILSAAMLLAAMLAAMALDWLVGWFDPRIRYAITGAALAIAAAAFVQWCLRPLLHRGTIVSTARQVDDSMPQLEERWSTVTELSEAHDAPEVRGSEAMIRKIAEEAETVGSAISPEAIVSMRPVARAGRWFAAAAAVLVILLAASFAQSSRLITRFWMPGKNISLTDVTATPGDGWTAKGEPLTIAASIHGRVPKGPTTLFLKPVHGGGKQVAMSPKTGTAAAFQYSIDQVADSFQYRVRSGDGQTPWRRIEAVDRPKISEVRLTVTPPSYSKLPVDKKTALPGTLRILEGSALEIGFRSDQALDRMLVDFGNGQSVPLAPSGDNWFTFRARPTNSFSLAAAAINKFKLENKNKPSCRISVYEDTPPSVKILEPSDNAAVLPGEKVNITFEASDDFGVAKAEVMVATMKADGETNTLTIPVDLGTNAGHKQFRKTVQLDPKALGLKHGDQLSYVVQVTDTKQVPAQAGVDAQQRPENATTPPPGSSEVAKNAAQQSPPPGQNENSQKEGKQDSAENPQQRSEEKQTAQGSPKESSSAKPGASKASSLAAAAKPAASESKPNNGSQPPPNDMAMRMLDAAQTSSCKPRNIKVDEYAGSFEGEKRQKLEIAIAPILAELEKLLAAAQDKTDSLKDPAASTAGLQEPHRLPLAGARTNIVNAQRAITDLKGRTGGTPYAFIGLQLYNINEAHIAPAAGALSRIQIPAEQAATNVIEIASASFHIARARAMLADLTRTFETVKRDQKIADALQKVNKMYQIFLEDTQALLGSNKGQINSYDRTMAEVDEQFVEKLKELLEQKKKVMAELATLLAEDPRLLRRYMAMLQLEGTNYRDQLTLLAERQKQIQQQIAQWNDAPETERPALIAKVRQSYAGAQRDLVRDATTLRENMETWLPLDMKARDEPIHSMLQRAEKVTLLAAENAAAVVSGTNSGNAGQKLANELQTLRDEIEGLQSQSDAHPKLPAYIVNRLGEIDALSQGESAAAAMGAAFASTNFGKAAGIVQDRLTQDTVKLSQKLESTQAQVSRLSPEIEETAHKLVKIVKAQIVYPQLNAVVQLEGRDLKSAAELENDIVPAFDRAEKTFDDLMEKIIAKLDEAPPPSDVGQAPGADDLMKMLENEMKAAEGLGIPPRPLNVNVMRDWMKPGSGKQSGGRGRAQADAARQQAQDAKKEAQRLEKQARESAQNALAAARADSAGQAGAPGARGESWNKLASRLQKDLLQGRDNTPPEQYRTAIENYFRIISERTKE